MQFDLGSELRRVRESKKLSLRAVASAVGVSASLLSQVETGKTQPSVSTLYALVNHLGISLDALMGTNRVMPGPLSAGDVSSVGSAPEPSTDRRSDAVVQRREDNPVIEMENGVTWERLSVGESAVADPLIVTYAPGASSSVEGKLMRHAALEYGVLLEGRLTLRIDFESYDLEPGDSFCFDANRPHLYINSSETPARGIWFVIGRREMAYQSLADLGHADDDAEPRPPASAVEVLQAMKAMRPGR
ncbi:cupin domain-containing protein [Microcella frigidaquae]|uniref:Transcriptional regulator with XRE-family HTH domain n=1 Tax=Microcella frigidaquae TaxID=424758 RepID=A0A840XPC2_9MICO|nr:cupin domain-containing protein [Microcella frigidaquae]MBB5618428.1 transcriptional regulator with XRE-family HTH domain [Microcella frigidaquae]NHN44669.1 cupin domain-containing protein [Microcella frigidaquae]